VLADIEALMLESDEDVKLIVCRNGKRGKCIKMKIKCGNITCRASAQWDERKAGRDKCTDFNYYQHKPPIQGD
jgi:hypothetical protein